MMEKEYFTTTQAARLLAVSPDTVLKWVKSGKISAYRTPGGHCRIPREAVESLIPASPDQSRHNASQALPYQYCWEMADTSADHCGAVNGCADCIVYRSRSTRCYELARVPELKGYFKLRCRKTCDECDYYRAFEHSGISVLVITKSAALKKRLNNGGTNDDIMLRFADSEYGTSAVIETFRPDYVVIDIAIGTGLARRLCSQISTDPRLPVPRVILASASKKRCQAGGHEALGWLRKPFDTEQIIRFVEEARQAEV